MSDRPVEEILAGNAFRDTLVPRADSDSYGAPLWHGWAIMDAFLAGIDHARKAPMPTETGAPRLVIVLNNGAWFIRRVACVHQDDTKGEMVYHCDENIGGPFASLNDAAGVLETYLRAAAN